MKKSNLIPIINDFFNNHEILIEDTNEIIECISIVANECDIKYTQEELLSLVKKKIKIIPPTYTSKDIEDLEKQIALLKQIKQPEQRTEEWYEFRRNRLTASDLATAIGQNVYANRNKLVASKCGYREDFKPGAAILHGVKFEPMATLFYEKLNNVDIYEYGCVPHPSIEYFAASPDGIVDPTSKNKSYIGRMLEIKCPKSRELNGFVPEYYELQIQGQLEVCNLEYCDYLECDIKECDPEVFYSLPKDKFKGIVFEIYDNTLKNYKYIYRTEDLDEESIKKWASEEITKILNDDNYEYIGLTYWYIHNYDVILVKRDQERFKEIKKKIDIFWEDVLKHREIGYETLVKKKYKAPSIPVVKHSFIDSD